MPNKKVEVKNNIQDDSISEIFHKNKHVGDVQNFEGQWWWRQPQAIMWWSATDFDDGVQQILGINKT